MTHTIKYNRAKRLSPIGLYHQTFAAIWQTIPEGVVAACTARQLAGVVTAMRISYNRGGTSTYRELVNEGAFHA